MKDNDVRGLRILVVDDEEDICDLIRFNLEEEGYVVSVSNNGMDALNKVDRNLPDAIILDLMIPGISGMELCKKIKSKFDVPILMVTARAGETDAVLGLEMGADDYIRKPFSPRELTKTEGRAAPKRCGRRRWSGRQHGHRRNSDEYCGPPSIHWWQTCGSHPH